MTPADTPCLYDMHCHLDFAGNAAELLAAARTAGIGGFWNTVTPAGYLAARQTHADGASACGDAAFELGVGLHPWWLADGSCALEDVTLFEDLARTTPRIGEVGLDFAPRREGTFDLQVHAFERVARICGAEAKTVSIHAVRSAGTVLDVLERSGACTRSSCIFHWFSGTGDELARAARLGCWFSLGTRTLATKRGRAYARAIPRDRLLLETDWPNDPVDRLDPAQWVASWRAELEQAVALMANALACDPADLALQLASNSRQALLP